jgi:hypothetical protein
MKELKMDQAWKNQAASLVEVQKLGGDLEKKVREILEWSTGKVIYDHDNNYKIQVDCAFPNIKNPEVIASVTYTKPDTRGHSNENKLQLKVGELALLKYAYPDIRVILVIGGSRDSWLPYVLKAFQYFYDETVFLWDDTGIERLNEIRRNPNSVKLRHTDFWNTLRTDWRSINLQSTDIKPPKGLVRYQIADELRNQSPRVHHPHLITNEIARACMHSAKINEGKEWDNFVSGNWAAIEMSRNFFNPVEALVEISLKSANIKYQGGIAHDVEVRSLLHDLGLLETSVSEDFVAYSKKYNFPVYIQCKASGGGREQHGKNIQNRSKEQVTRGLIYRCRLKNNELKALPKDFIWISILDGDWGVTASSPLKYIHMLQLAGYDKLLGASELLTNDLGAKNYPLNPLTRFLIDDLDCELNDISNSIS